MKVALVFDGLQVGGIERVGLTYIKLFQNLGYEVTVINLNPKLTDLETKINNKTKVIHTILPRKLAPEQYAQLIKQIRLGKWIYPLIHLILSLILLIYKIVLKFVDSVYRDKFDLVIAFSGHFNDLTFVANNFLKATKKMCWLHGTLYGYILISDGFVNLYKKIKNLIVLSNDAQDETLAYNRRLNLNIFKLYNPVSFSDEQFDSKKVHNLKTEYGKFILMVGRFEYPKNQKMIVEVIKILYEEYGIDLNVIFAGDGPTESEVKAYAASISSIKDKVFFAGNQFDIQNYYRAAELLVHSSAYEGLPTVLLEAMAIGIPVVTTNSKSGAGEIMQDSKYGLVSEVGNARDMAEKIHRIFTERGLYEHYINKGYERIKDFAPETIKIQLKSILSEVMDS
jgi:glycosyltransferase involved in cell wall biosynthesis